MKQLILDKLRRQKWMWAAFCLFFFIIGFMVPTGEASFNVRNFWWMFYLFAFSDWMSELRTGYRRVVLTLPVTTQKIGQFLWLMSVGLPTLLLAIFSGLGFLISALNTGNWGFTTYIRLVLMGGLLFGSSFWIQSGTPLKPSEKPSRRAAQQIYGWLFIILLWGGGYLLYKAKCSGEIKYAVVCLLGLVFTVLGWFRAEGLVVDYAEYRQTAASGTKGAGIFRPPSGFGGIRFFLARSGIRQLGMMFGVYVFFAAMRLASTHKVNQVDFTEFAQISPVFFLCFAIAEVATVMLHLKYMRTLPLTSKQLAGTLLVIALTPFLILSAAIAGIVCLKQGVPAGFSLFKTYVLGLAPICVLITAAIWHGEKRFGRIVLVVAVFLISAIAPIYQLTTGAFNSNGHDLPVWFITGYPLAFVVMALFAISQLLENNDMTYRIRAQDINGGFGWGAGR